ncbi:MAG: hypothetical protein J6Y19_05005 [Kiritimatiellae bacterium]|nr:hypothetical protein [Kiritimatiellia bacterium]
MFAKKALAIHGHRTPKNRLLDQAVKPNAAMYDTTESDRKTTSEDPKNSVVSLSNHNHSTGAV